MAWSVFDIRFSSRETYRRITKILRRSEDKVREQAQRLRKLWDLSGELLAERQGFEPWIPFRVYTLSKRAPSATRPSLRALAGRDILTDGEKGRASTLPLFF
jgi:hypothetical protein